MLGGNAAWRVPIVVRPLDRALALTKFALIPLLLFAAGVSTLKTLTGTTAVSGIAGVGALALVYVIVLQIDTVEQRVDRMLALARRRVALACDHDFRSSHRDGLACHLTAEAFRAPVFRYDAQQAAVASLAQACDAESHGQFWFVEGTSGSGKTRTALLLVHTLIRDLRHFELGSRCYLYDFSEAAGVQDHLLRRLGSPRHDGAVVLVDNFQLVRPDVLRVITERLVERPRPTEQLVVFLARPGDTWNLSRGADARILSAAKRADRHVRLGGPSAEDVTRRVSALDREAAGLLRAIGDGTVATAAQLHLAQVVVRNGGVPEDVRQVLRLLAGDGASEHDGLLEALGRVCAVTVHRGSFRRRELVGLTSRAVGGWPWPRLRAVARSLRDVRRLHRVGLVTRLNLGGTRFVFHEAIGDLCVDRLTGRLAFDEAFQQIARTRVGVLQRDHEALGAWLVSVELGAQEILTDTFDEAMARGAYTRMARSLSRAATRYSLNDSSALQLAILLDRTGDFAGSRRLIAEAGIDLASEDRLAAMLTAQRIETAHGAQSLEDAARLRRHPTRDVSLVGEYWQLHMAAHRGEFAPERLLELATEMAALSHERSGYWTTYATARMHFDSLRHAYLSGTVSATALVLPERQRIDDVLHDHLPIFEALHVLYGKAHLAGHVLLPRLALFGDLVSPDAAALAEIGEADSRSPETLAVAVERLYRRARDVFWQYGDREADYLQADVLNAGMIQAGADLDGVEGALQAYERFVEETGFADLRSYPQLYFVRWHVLRYFAGLTSAPAAVDALDQSDELDQATRRLERVFEYDTAVGNAYGLHRAEMIRLLLRALVERFDSDAALSLAARMTARNYRFEAEILTHLADMGRVPIATLLAVFRYYPIVHQ